jgi:prevent-host-death family protein
VGAHEFRNHFGLYMERAARGSEILIRRHGRAYACLGPPNLNSRPPAADD